jgi:hypothetical protein
MGLLGNMIKKVWPGAGAAPESSADPPWGGRRPDKADYGRAGAPMPDVDALVTEAEILAVTGSSPVGEPRRNEPDGSESDLGRSVIREWQLANGDKFLLSVGNCASPSAAQLGMDRKAEYEKPLEGVGERGLVDVNRHPKKGSSEVGVSALSRNFMVALVHTSTEGRTDAGPLTDLLRTVLTRL